MSRFKSFLKWFGIGLGTIFLALGAGTGLIVLAHSLLGEGFFQVMTIVVLVFFAFASSIFAWDMSKYDKN